jgi:hypothetical protein
MHDFLAGTGKVTTFTERIILTPLSYPWLTFSKEAARNMRE